MSGINKVILVGHVGKDPEIKQVANGTLAKLTLATTERYKNKAGERQERTEWHNITLWSPLAEIAERYVRKGSKLYIEGRFQTRSYEDNTGNKRYATEVVAREMLMLDSRSSSAEGSYVADAQAPGEAPPSPPAAEADDDLPF